MHVIELFGGKGANVHFIVLFIYFWSGRRLRSPVLFVDISPIFRILELLDIVARNLFERLQFGDKVLLKELVFEI